MSVEKKVDRTDNKFTVTLSKKKEEAAAAAAAKKKDAVDARDEVATKKKDMSVYGSIPSTSPSTGTTTPPTTSPAGSKPSKSPMKSGEVATDEKNLEAVIQNITQMNKKIRDKYELTTPKTPDPTEATTDSDCSMDFSNANKMLNELKIVDGERIKKCDHVDYMGRPLTHALAMTPYPAASTIDRRDKAQSMLRNLSKKSSNISVYIPTSDEVTAKSKLEKPKPAKPAELPKNICQKCGTCMICAKRCDKSHEGGKTLTEQAREMSAKKKIRLRRLRNTPRRRLSHSVDTSETSSDSPKRKKNCSKKIVKKKPTQPTPAKQSNSKE